MVSNLHQRTYQRNTSWTKRVTDETVRRRNSSSTQLVDKTTQGRNNLSKKQLLRELIYELVSSIDTINPRLIAFKARSDGTKSSSTKHLQEHHVQTCGHHSGGKSTSAARLRVKTPNSNPPSPLNQFIQFSDSPARPTHSINTRHSIYGTLSDGGSAERSSMQLHAEEHRRQGPP